MAKAGVNSKTLGVKHLFDEAVAHHRGGRFQQAEQLYRNILEGHPTHADALHLLGLVAYQGLEYDRARDLIGQAIQQDGKKALYHYNLGLVCEKAGQLDEAARAYQQALQLKSDYVEAHSNLGNVYREQGDLKSAVLAFEHAIAIKPDYAGGYNNLGVVFKEQGDLDRAIGAYQQALRLNPRNAESHYNLGMVYLEREQSEEATAAFRKAIDINPEYAKAHHNLGLALLWQDQRDEALLQFRKSADLSQDHGRSVNMSYVFPSRIKHDLEQLEYLCNQGIAMPIPEGYSETLRVLQGQVVSSQEANQPIAVSPSQAKALAPSFNRILHYADNPIFPEGALNPNLDREDIQRRYQASNPEIIFIDDLLRDDAVRSLHRFCLESTIWKKDYVEGYIGAFFK